MIASLFSILLTFLQTAQTGTVVGVVKLDNGGSVEGARIALLSPKYTEVWNKQVQTRLDNYWEIFKPDFAAKKERFVEFERLAQVEAFRYVTLNMRRELGDSSLKFMRETSANGQFEFGHIPFGTYQLLVNATVRGQDLVWSKTVDVQSEIPIFVDLGKPVS